MAEKNQSEFQEKEIVNPIDKDKITEEPHKLSYPHTVGSPLIKPEDQGEIHSNALTAMEHQTDIQLKQIYEQMNLLVKQAKELQHRKEISEIIYRAEIRFTPLINHIYHLYRKQDGRFFLSLIAPEQWGKSGDNFEFTATVQLLGDHTWNILEKADDFEFSA